MVSYCLRTLQNVDFRKTSVSLFVRRDGGSREMTEAVIVKIVVAFSVEVVVEVVHATDLPAIVV